MKGRKWIPVVVLIALCAGIFGYIYERGDKEDREGKMTLYGNVDVREVSLAFRASDRIRSVTAEEGDQVKKGDVLAALDSEELELALQKLDAKEEAQQNVVDKLVSGSRKEDVAQAKANYDSLSAAADEAAGIYERRKKIYDESQGISRQELDSARHNADARAASARAAYEAWQLAENGSRVEDIRAAEAELKALQAEKAQTEYQLSQYVLKAPADGIIRSRLLEVGDMASPSSPVFKISLMDKKWVRVYVNEKDLGRIHEGMEVDIYIDSRKDSPIKGQVGYISSTAEFTPKTVQTEELRTSLVYEARIYADDPDNILRLGMPATVVIDGRVEK